METNANNDTVTNDGFISGNATWKKMRPSPAPSIRAASIREVGTLCPENVHIKYRPNGFSRDGIITAQGVFVKPSCEKIKNCGTTSSTPGIAIDPKMVSKIKCLPLKLSFARAYPPIVANNTEMIVPIIVYRTVFRIHRAKMPLLYVNTSTMLSHRANEDPNDRPNVEAKSALVFVEFMNSQTNGTRAYNRYRYTQNVIIGLFFGCSTV